MVNNKKHKMLGEFIASQGGEESLIMALEVMRYERNQIDLDRLLASINKYVSITKEELLEVLEEHNKP